MNHDMDSKHNSHLLFNTIKYFFKDKPIFEKDSMSYVKKEIRISNCRFDLS